MKKLLAISLILILFLIPASLAEEEETSPIAGAWYTDLSDVPVEMNLEDDGTYTISIPGCTPETGTWELRNELVYLNGSETPAFSVKGETLAWEDASTVFTREKTAGYTPAEVAADIPAECLNGYWTSIYVDVKGTAYPAAALNDRTDLYVEGNYAVLGGPVFGDVVVKMEPEGGALVSRNEGLTVTIQLQTDAVLRLTMSVEGEDLIWYLEPGSIPAEMPEE